MQKFKYCLSLLQRQQKNNFVDVRFCTIIAK